ncbi:hypothetical protein CDD81_3665 [Ophiocordyceps australis]|uniref:DNA mismatch repair protein MSH5 n=1 Tax=Ophiocordyceps australis TaxID=1399860 RepID=A0A2C5X765_9HYPO|nr:hypothetical protein CDD81_3665 [Ophiocordyceps australis]
MPPPYSSRQSSTASRRGRCRQAPGSSLWTAGSGTRRGQRFSPANTALASGQSRPLQPQALSGPTSSSSARIGQSSSREQDSHSSHGALLEIHQAVEAEDEASEDILQETIMALDMRDGACMGCACFSTATGVLSLSEDVALADMDIAEHFLSHVEPTTLLISARAPERLMDLVEKLAAPGEQSANEHQRFILRALASSEFSPASAREKLVALQVDRSPKPAAIFSVRGGGCSVGGDLVYGIPDTLDHEESRNFKLMRLGTLINFESRIAVTCAGAVLGELGRRRSGGCFSSDPDAASMFQVSSIETFSLENFVFVNTETLGSLQIIQAEFHPNSQSWGTDGSKAGTKESLSVYGLFHHLASTPQGRIRLRQLFLRPTMDMSIISERQCVITMLLRPENAEFVKQATAILRKMCNIRNIVSQLQKGVDCPSSGRSWNKGVWATLRKFSAQVLKLRDLASSILPSTDARTVHELVGSIRQADLVAVGEMINRTIDFEQSENRRRSSVRTGVDARLDEVKRRYDGMSSFLTEVVNQVSQTVPDWASQYIRSCIFLPQLGFLMAVELDIKTGNGKYEGEGLDMGRWEKLFISDDIACYKNSYMRELDEQYGDMYCEIGDREVEIIHDLATAVLEYKEALMVASDACGGFDALMALAIGANKYNLTAPQMTQENVVQIYNGRHPLQELVVPNFVPNDCDIAGGSGEAMLEQQANVMVLTGPNHSGKSVYLKQVAIIVYLAHVGSFVPADKAIVGVTDKILTRISTRESMCCLESAFAIDVKQAAQAMRFSTRQSLVLVDEFGKGTNPDDGAGLFAAVLNHFLSLGSQVPRVLVTTHFHEIMEGGYLDHHRGLVVAHMDVRTDWQADPIEDQVTYLFRLTSGHSASSFGGQCAALNGVPRAVVDRAEALSLLLSRNEDLGASCAELSHQEEQRLEAAEAVARRFLQEDFDRCSNGAESGRNVKDVLSSVLGVCHD